MGVPRKPRIHLPGGYYHVMMRGKCGKKFSDFGAWLDLLNYFKSGADIWQLLLLCHIQTNH